MIQTSSSRSPSSVDVNRENYDLLNILSIPVCLLPESWWASSLPGLRRREGARSEAYDSRGVRLLATYQTPLARRLASVAVGDRVGGLGMQVSLGPFWPTTPSPSMIRPGFPTLMRLTQSLFSESSFNVGLSKARFFCGPLMIFYEHFLIAANSSRTCFVASIEGDLICWALNCVA